MTGSDTKGLPATDGPTPPPADVATGVGGLLLGSAASVAPGRAAAGSAQAESLLWSPLAGRAVLAWSLQTLLQVPRMDELVFLVDPGREPAAAGLVASVAAGGGGRSAAGCRIAVRSSPDPLGEVPLGLDSLSAGCRMVVILEGSRPLVTPESIIRGIEVATANEGSGAVAFSPVRETIKQTQGDIVVSTLPREELALLHGPLVFPRVSLSAAYQAYQMSHIGPLTSPVDPVVVAHAAGMNLVPFPGEPADILISSQQDLRIAEAYLRGRTS